MIKKLERYIREEDGVKISCPPDNVHIIRKINELVDVVNTQEEQLLGLSVRLNEMQQKVVISKMENAETPTENVQPDYVTTSYMTNGHTKEYYGQKGASIVTDYPLPAGYVITIREPETKGSDNE